MEKKGSLFVFFSDRNWAVKYCMPGGVLHCIAEKVYRGIDELQHHPDKWRAC